MSRLFDPTDSTNSASGNSLPFGSYTADSDIETATPILRDIQQDDASVSSSNVSSFQTAPEPGIRSPASSNLLSQQNGSSATEQNSSENLATEGRFRDRQKLKAAAKLCVDTLKVIYSKNNQLELDEKSDEICVLEEKLKDFNESDLDHIGRIVKAEIPDKDAPEVECFKDIQSSIVREQTEVFEKKQWDFEKSIDAYSKVTTHPYLPPL